MIKFVWAVHAGDWALYLAATEEMKVITYFSVLGYHKVHTVVLWYLSLTS